MNDELQPRLAALEEKVNAIYLLLTEYNTRYTERFNAQEKAINLSITSSDKAVQAAERTVAAVMIAAEKAIVKAEIAYDKRFDSINEFRAVLTDQQTSLVRKSEMEVKFVALEDKVTLLYNIQLEQKGKLAAQNLLWIYFMGAVGVVGTIVAFFKGVK